MTWKSSADGLMKWKKGAEKTLRGFGQGIRNGYNSWMKYKNSPEGRYKSHLRIYYDGGGGNKPRREDYK